MGFRELLKFANTSDIKRGLNEPGRAKRAVLRAVSDSGQDSSVPDWDEAEDELVEFLGELLETEEDEISRILRDLETDPLVAGLEEDLTFFDNKSYNSGGTRWNGRIAYVVSRIIQPTTILEIGVANGVSTVYLLAALEEGEHESRVHAMDRPSFERDVKERPGSRALNGRGGVIPTEKEVCWLAPIGTRENHNHQLHIGDFTETLPSILEVLGGLDLMLYDASKDATEMEYAYETGIESLNEGGVLLSDDVNGNDAFERTVTGRRGDWRIIRNSGIFRKRE